MPKKKIYGRPKGRQRLKLNEVLELLPKDGSLIQAKELKQMARKRRISPNTLFGYMGLLERNSLVLKNVDPSFRPPKVYYKLITEEEFFGKEDFLKINAYLERMWPMAEKLPEIVAQTPLKEIPDLFKKTILESWLGLFTAYFAVIGAKASEIKDVSRKKEFIDLTIRIHLLPKLLKWSSLTWIEPKHWGSALGIVDEIQQKSIGSFNNELRNIIRRSRLPSSVSEFILEFLGKLKEGPSDKDIEDMVKSAELLLESKGEEK